MRLALRRRGHGLIVRQATRLPNGSQARVARLVLGRPRHAEIEVLVAVVLPTSVWHPRWQTCSASYCPQDPL